jgi:Ca2+-binding RTX toxin-like protein
MIEPLESRRLLAVTAVLSADGVLSVTGDAEPNPVFIGRRVDPAAGTDEIFVRSRDVVLGTFANSDVASIRVDLLAGNDALETAHNVLKPMTALGGEGNDRLTTGGGNDLVDGGIGNDTQLGGGGNDQLHGGDGNDLLDGALGADVMHGGMGLDTVSYAMRATPVRVTLDNAPNDGTPATVSTPGENDNVRLDVERVLGGRGNDFLSAAPTMTPAGPITPGRVTLEGGAGNDVLIGSNGLPPTTTTPVAPGPTSILNGGEGNDSITGGMRDDQILGGGGNDNLRGGDGNDLLDGGPGGDVMAGGAGIDQVLYVHSRGGVAVTLNDDLPNDGLPATTTFPGEHDNAMSDIERVNGSRFADHLTGTDAPNTIGGGDGNDVIYGLGGNDVIDGGMGDDELYGGNGDDRLMAGPGSDSLFGEDGNDSLFARDGIKDILDGGAGDQDRASRDEGIDEVTNVEIFVV